MNTLTDRYTRTIDYLRISITDHCNLKCRYCVPFGGRAKLSMDAILTYEEIHTITRAAVEAGVSKIRLTGGEPLMRKGMLQFCQWIAAMKEIKDLSVTTNGVLLEEMVDGLKDAGVKRINVSLDTLKPERYRAITGKDRLSQVLRGIEKAASIGLSPIKINMVPMRGVNDDEIIEMARWTQQVPYDVRFIELMPTNGWAREKHNRMWIPVDEIREKVETIAPLEDQPTIKTRGPATYARLPGAKGRIGFIAALSHHFCATCNRLRLTADGKLRACLFTEEEVDIITPLREGADLEQLKSIIQACVAAKPEGHRLNDDSGCNRGGRIMRAIGG